MVKVKKVKCPHCGEVINRGLSSCPHCGSDKNTGWSSQADDYLVSGGYGEDDFDYDDYLDKEFSGGKDNSAKWAKITAVIVLVLLILFYVLM